MVQVWQDHRLSVANCYKEMGYTNISAYEDPPRPMDIAVQNNIWHPVITIDNVLGVSEVSSMEPEGSYMSIDFNGTIFKSNRYQAEINCDMSFRKYPFDSHECLFSIYVGNNYIIALVWYGFLGITALQKMLNSTTPNWRGICL